MMRFTRALQVARFMRGTRQQHATASGNKGSSSSLRHAFLLGGVGLSGVAGATAYGRGDLNSSSTAAFASPAAQCEASPGIVKKLTLDGGRFETLDAASPVTRVTCATYKANAPIEDRFAVQTTASNGDVYAAVFDGHGGWQVASFVSKTLIANVETELAALTNAGEVPPTPEASSSPEQVTMAIQRAFLRTDRELMWRVKPAFELGFGAVGRTGSCALLAVIRDGYLHIANVGDSRAVLGKQQAPMANADDSTLLAVPLSHDHTATRPFEQAKLRREHPGEENVVLCPEPDSCYIRGALQPTRAFGDFALKYSEFNGPPYVDGNKSAGYHAPAPFSPPYITAAPETTSLKLRDPNDQFLILGSDGVWDFLSNEQAVECVREQAARGDFENAGRALVEKTLQYAAKKHGITYEEILELAPGDSRRPVHDDTTVVILFF